MAQRIDNDDGGVSGRQEINDVSTGLETTTEAERIWGRRRRLRHCYYRTDELATMKELSEEEDEPEVLTMKTEASTDQA